MLGPQLKCWFTGGQGLVTGSQDMTAIVWDCTGVQQRVLRGHTAAIWALAVLPSGQISTGSSDKTVMVWSLDGKLLHTLNGVYLTAMHCCYSQMCSCYKGVDRT